MEYRLEELCNISSSKRIYRKEYQQKGIPFYRGKEIIQKANNIPISDKLYISTEKYNEIEQKYGVPHKGDILITAVGTIGVSYLVKDERFYFKDGNLIWIKDFDKKVDNEYLFIYLNSLKFKNELEKIAIGSTQRAITIIELKKIKINLPSIEIQKKMVKIYKGLDKKIELNNQTNDNLLEIGKSCFKRWLENCNDEKYIYEIADEIINYEKNSNSKVKLLNSSDITENVFPKVEYVENKNLKGHFKKRFKKYDILYSQIRPNNHHFGYALIENCEEYLISTRFMVVRNKPNLVSSPLLYFYLTSDKAISDFTAKTESRSGTFPQGNFEDLSSCRVKYSANQIQITNILDNVLNKFYKNNIENELLEEIRDTLLPKLMNGEIDLDKIEN